MLYVWAFIVHLDLLDCVVGCQDLSLPRKLGLEVGGRRVVYMLQDKWQVHCDTVHTT